MDAISIASTIAVIAWTSSITIWAWKLEKKLNQLESRINNDGRNGNPKFH